MEIDPPRKLNYNHQFRFLNRVLKSWTKTGEKSFFRPSNKKSNKKIGVKFTRGVAGDDIVNPLSAHHTVSWKIRLWSVGDSSADKEDLDRFKIPISGGFSWEPGRGIWEGKGDVALAYRDERTKKHKNGSS